MIQQSCIQYQQAPTPMPKRSASSVIGLPLEKIGNKWFWQPKSQDQAPIPHTSEPQGFPLIVFNRPWTGACNDSKRIISIYTSCIGQKETRIFLVLLDKPDENEQWKDNFHEILETLDDCIKAGKIRHIGLSNESPWGVMKYLALSEFANLPRMKTIQNPYSLLNRKFEVGNAEVAHREQLGLLAYSPMAFGILSGKYRGGKLPKNSRLQLFPRMVRYNSEESLQATEHYASIADKYGLSLAQMSLAFVTDQPFVTSNIIGATTMTQLRENIASATLTLSDEILDEIDEVQKQFSNPAP